MKDIDYNPVLTTKIKTIIMTIAQQLKVKEFPFIIKDAKGNEIYYENSDGYWYKCEYDANGNEIYYENSDEYWYKYEFDAKGKRIYFEDNVGYIQDNRLKKECD